MSRHGFQVATPGPMPKEQQALDEPVAIVKEYPAPQFVKTDESDDALRHAKIDIGWLRSELKRAKSRMARLESEIGSEIKMLTAALERGETETREQVKRRISRLKGSLDYKGHE